MIVAVPFFASLLVAAFFEGREEASEPTLEDLEEALRATAGMRYGEDEEESPFRPHELLLRMDAESVPDDLLLGVLLAGATSGDPLEAARRLMAEAHHDVTRLREPSLWAQTRGVGTAGRARIVAAAELARRMDVRSAFSRRMDVTSPQKAVAALKSMSLGPDEILSVLFLDRRHRLIGGQILTVGSSAFTVVDPKQIFQRAVEMGAGALILAHNHPSGDPTPSSQDYDVTERVARAGRVLGIPLIDHVVLGSGDRYISLSEEGRLPAWGGESSSWTADR